MRADLIYRMENPPPEEYGLAELMRDDLFWVHIVNYSTDISAIMEESSILQVPNLENMEEIAFIAGDGEILYDPLDLIYPFGDCAPNPKVGS